MEVSLKPERAVTIPPLLKLLFLCNLPCGPNQITFPILKNYIISSLLEFCLAPTRGSALRSPCSRVLCTILPVPCAQVHTKHQARSRSVSHTPFFLPSKHVLHFPVEPRTMSCTQVHGAQWRLLMKRELYLL